MIEATHFVECAAKQGFTLYTGVPCSYLTPFINTVIGDGTLRYVSSANEGDAVATAAGAALGGGRAVVMMQNSGLGNAVSPLASLTWAFRIPLLLVVTLRGDPEFPDEPQHELMGAITPAMLESLQVPWEFFPSEPEQIEPALRRACEFMETERRPTALILRKGIVAGEPLRETPPESRFPGEGVISRRRDRSADQRPSRRDALERIVAATPPGEAVVIASTGYTGRELFSIEDRANQLYMVGSMGCASSLALGLSLARPDVRVVVVDGDGGALMRMGNFSTVGAYGGGNLVHVVLDNESHESTGGQGSVSFGVSFARIAAACGYARALEGDDVSLLDDLFRADGPGPRFAHLKIRRGTPTGLPRPDVTPEQVAARLAKHLRGIAG